MQQACTFVFERMMLINCVCIRCKLTFLFLFRHVVAVLIGFVLIVPHLSAPVLLLSNRSDRFAAGLFCCDANFCVSVVRLYRFRLRCLCHRRPVRRLSRLLKLANPCTINLLLCCAVEQLLKLAGCGSSATGFISETRHSES